MLLWGIGHVKQTIELFSSREASSMRIGYRLCLSVQVVQLSPTGFQFPSSSPSFARQDKREKLSSKSAKAKLEWLYASEDRKTN
jgi:hypothetical protein